MHLKKSLICVLAAGGLAGCDSSVQHTNYRPAAAYRSSPQSGETLPAVGATDTDSDPLSAGDSDETNAANATNGADNRDPLASGESDLGDGSQPKMPTMHSHWLRISQYQEHITILLNNVWYRDYYGAADQDITMNLRSGLNTITVKYRSLMPGSWFNLRVIESEHTPPIPDLVTLLVPPSQNDPQHDLDLKPDEQEVTRTFSFMAK